jgi:hypothetical protein
MDRVEIAVCTFLAEKERVAVRDYGERRFNSKEIILHFIISNIKTSHSLQLQVALHFSIRNAVDFFSYKWDYSWFFLLHVWGYS